MPLVRDGRFVAEDGWRRAGEGETPRAGAAAIFPLAALSGADAAIAEAVELDGSADIAAVEPHLARLKLVVIGFPKFSDGRGFTLAARLRRAGYAGTLRAAGHVIADQYAFALSCGFDEIEIADALARRQPEQHWRDALAAMTIGYQPARRGPANILAARRGAGSEP